MVASTSASTKHVHSTPGGTNILLIPGIYEWNIQNILRSSIDHQVYITRYILPGSDLLVEKAIDSSDKDVRVLVYTRYSCSGYTWLYIRLLNVVAVWYWYLVQVEPATEICYLYCCTWFAQQCSAGNKPTAVASKRAIKKGRLRFTVKH